MDYLISYIWFSWSWCTPALAGFVGFIAAFIVIYYEYDYFARSGAELKLDY
jgi:hypothetical protein